MAVRVYVTLPDGRDVFYGTLASEPKLTDLPFKATSIRTEYVET